MRTGPWYGSASQISLMMWGKACPNCIHSSATSLFVVLFKMGVPSLGFADRLSMRHVWWCSWGTASMQEILSFYPNTRTMSASGRRMLNTSRMHCPISPHMNDVVSVVHADTWGPRAMDLSSICCNQADPVCTGIPSNMYYSSRDASRHRTASSSAPRVPHYCEAMISVR